MSVPDRIDLAGRLYERAVFGGDTDGLATADTALDAVEADLALARGRIIHARYLRDRSEDPRELGLFERAAELYRQGGDARGEAEALFWVGCFHQVVRDDNDTAVPLLERSLALAGEAGDRLTASYALRHLGIAEHVAGRLDGARARLEESVRLRRELGFDAGVAANLVGLAYIASAGGSRADALALLDEADELAGAADAGAIARQVAEARTHV
ncbi:tetratricopeptide repeat protein [Longispora sp. K20-0274]|uniref:tetratricopeptide repeat protein n=1 Tax=Longispora sp. K20-0274 TaxID=3088255 RepID=UPI00399A6CC8